MIVERISPMTGKATRRAIAITRDQLNRWKNGELIQDVAPDLSIEDREFLITGMTEEDWDRLEEVALP